MLTGYKKVFIEVKKKINKIILKINDEQYTYITYSISCIFFSF